VSGRRAVRAAVAVTLAASTGWAAVAAAAGPGAAVGAGAAGSGGGDRPRGDVRLFAHVPAPGYPALSLVTPDRVYVGTFTGVAGGTTGPSKVFAWTHGGRLVRTYTVRGQTPGGTHAVQVAAQDRQGRLYLLDQSPPRVVRLDPRTGRQRTWATFADVPTCSSAGAPQECSNTLADNPPEPDYAAWLPDGSMVVTDYAQQLLWRVPPGGGRARVWLNDLQLDGEEFGPAGIVLRPNHRSLLLMVSASIGVNDPDPDRTAARGALYRIRIDSSGHPTDLARLWRSGPGEAPDGPGTRSPSSPADRWGTGTRCGGCRAPRWTARRSRCRGTRPRARSSSATGCWSRTRPTSPGTPRTWWSSTSPWGSAQRRRTAPELQVRMKRSAVRRGAAVRVVRRHAGRVVTGRGDRVGLLVRAELRGARIGVLAGEATGRARPGRLWRRVLGHAVALPAAGADAIAAGVPA
jgi:hypothetical protein